MKNFKIILFAGLLSLMPLSDLNSSEPLNKNKIVNPEISYLVNYFENKDYDIQEFLSDNRFEVYENIHKFFINSPEANADKKIKKELSEEEQKKIFKEQYEKYKIALGFYEKTKQIKDFIQEYEGQLSEAENKYKISKEIIASTLGIESDFGKNDGKYNPFNAYVSLYLSGYKQDFAIQQLEELLIFCANKNKNVFELKSSYAGAIGFAQFLPYSLNRWFVGNDVYDMNDNINSVANYLSYFKEKTDNLETAILRYNPSKFYVKSVLELAESAGFEF